MIGGNGGRAPACNRSGAITDSGKVCVLTPEALPGSDTDGAKDAYLAW
ncbi:MAG: hypothetical protein ACK5O2_17575 [Microthrixaceae bacterium]